MPNLRRPLERQVKTVFFDIETAPIIGAMWRRYDTNMVGTPLQDWRILCFSYRWAHQKQIPVVAQCDFDDYDPEKKPWTHDDDGNVARALWKILDEADIVVAHNSPFDEKKSNSRFRAHGLGPPSPFKTVDTLKVMRARFKETSNRLGDIGEQWGLGEKAPSSYSLWDGCMHGDLNAWRLMRRYNRQDVHLLIKVYLELLPWMTNHPHLGLMSGRLDGCRNCGEVGLEPAGYDYTATRIRERAKCPKCGAFSHRTKSLAKIAAAYS